MSGPELTAAERERLWAALRDYVAVPGAWAAPPQVGAAVAAIADARAQAAVEAERERIAYAIDTHGDEAWFDLTGVRTYEEAMAMKGAYHHAAAVAGGLEPCLDEHADCRGVE